MCKAIDDMRKESKAEGIAEGKANTIKENIKTMYKNGADEMTIAKLLSLDLCFVKEVLSA